MYLRVRKLYTIYIYIPVAILFFQVTASAYNSKPALVLDYFG